MGVSGSGKTTLGEALVRHLETAFQEGHGLHPRHNIEKLRAGVPLDDADRVPWLDAVAGWIGMHRESGGVISCSALRRAYRDRLRQAAARLRYVLLDVDAAILRERVAHGPGHFMPASLLRSQLDLLERPATEERDVLTVAGTPARRRSSRPCCAGSIGSRSWATGHVPAGVSPAPGQGRPLAAYHAWGSRFSDRSAVGSVAFSRRRGVQSSSVAARPKSSA